MLQATDLKAGVTFQIDGKPYKVLKYFHQKLGRGGATVRITVKNLATGKQVEKTFNSNHKVEEISTIRKPLQFLYLDRARAVFMDIESYEQVEIPIPIIKEELLYIKEGVNVGVLFWDDQPLSVEIPPKATLEVVETPPGVKGDSATNIYKQAKLENGLTLKVPLFVKRGDKIVVDTRTGEYVERAKNY
ncbi:elongation factor P [Patescibacteria group bacterium]|nr:elongation factor P [Patescibacteria group bacterium]